MTLCEHILQINRDGLRWHLYALTPEADEVARRYAERIGAHYGEVHGIELTVEQRSNLIALALRRMELVADLMSGVA